MKKCILGILILFSLLFPAMAEDAPIDLIGKWEVRVHWIVNPSEDCSFFHYLDYSDTPFVFFYFEADGNLRIDTGDNELTATWGVAEGAKEFYVEMGDGFRIDYTYSAIDEDTYVLVTDLDDEVGMWVGSLKRQ